ncbi:hypothetical protein BOCO_1323 [Bombiscardovia coagulans]|uniref:Uncharacterized protein n=1 Tax=Bombiscardovia coagulans TaxID=686666 RepID=A0A261EP40_9BIFI|nr:hypothetical protein BOCO_1323 [Bombiscardovia coagulans]
MPVGSHSSSYSHQPETIRGFQVGSSAFLIAQASDTVPQDLRQTQFSP